MTMRAAFLLPLPLLVLALASCGQNSVAPPPDVQQPETAQPQMAETPSQTPPPPPPPPPAIMLDIGAVDSTDCGRVLRYYATALHARLFPAASRIWPAQSGVDGTVLQQRYADYRSIDLQIGKLSVEEAAGSLFCEAQVTLLEAAGTGRAPQRGVITLRRVNDVPGATAQQRRWTIRQSTLGEDVAGADRPPPR